MANLFEELADKRIRPIDLDEARELIDEIEHTDTPDKTVIELNGWFFDITMADSNDVVWLLKNAKRLKEL